MTKVLEGQLNALDLLEPPARKPAANIWWSMTKDRPSPEIPWYCTACGHESTTWHQFITLHDSAFMSDGQRVCSPMHMSRSHIKSRVSLIHRALASKDSFYCCVNEKRLHGREIKNPTAMQHADHLRHEIDRAREVWGVRAADFDAWLGPYLVANRALRYSLDPAEYPEEFATFTVHLSSTFPKQPCGYCGKELTMSEGNGGGTHKLPDGRHVHWQICNRCSADHGWPEIETHTNLKVVP